MSGKILRLCHASTNDLFHRGYLSTTESERMKLFASTATLDVEADVIRYENIHFSIVIGGVEKMNTRKFIEIMSVAEQLKNNTRHSWTSTNRHESVAEHSWRLSLMAYFVKDEFPDVDINKVILMCICHDLGEAITGDIPAFNKTESDEIKENREVHQLLSNLPEPYKKELSMLFLEMNEQKTIESKIYKALDKMEAVIQHNEADISTWIPLEYELNLTYGEKEVEFSKYMKELKQTINEDSINKIIRAKESVS